MCLIAFAYNIHPVYRLILISNRDEFYNRPTLPLGFWKNYPDIIAGKDLKGNGTWMGITQNGLFSAVTNLRDPTALHENATSRGLLVKNFLCNKILPKLYLQKIKKNKKNYNPFNILIGNKKDFYYYSNIQDKIIKLSPGLYGLSNHLLDTPWPKVLNIKKKLKEIIYLEKESDPEILFNILENRSFYPQKKLPNTGIGCELERLLSPIFVVSKDYGTRCSSIVFIKHSGRITIMERTYKTEGYPPFCHNTKIFST